MLLSELVGPSRQACLPALRLQMLFVPRQDARIPLETTEEEDGLTQEVVGQGSRLPWRHYCYC